MENGKFIVNLLVRLLNCYHTVFGSIFVGGGGKWAVLGQYFGGEFII